MGRLGFGRGVFASAVKSQREIRDLVPPLPASLIQQRVPGYPYLRVPSPLLAPQSVRSVVADTSGL